MVYQGDVTVESDCKKLIKEANNLGSVGMIFNLAVTLRDKLFENQSVNNFNEVFKPKVDITMHLDQISRLECPNLKEFVVFSSIACGLGNSGQSNYGMANSIAERIVEKRVKEGYPGKAIQWGAIGDVGILEKQLEMKKDLEIAGTVPQEIDSCLQVLDKLLTSNETIVLSMVTADKKSIEQAKNSVVDVILDIMSVRDRRLPPMNIPLSKMGIDSLMAVEIQQVLERDFNTVMSSHLLRILTLEDIKNKVGSEGKEDIILFEDFADEIKQLMTIFGDENLVDDIVKANDIESGDSPIALIIPGIFGTAAEHYFIVARALKYPTYIMQFFKTSNITDFDEVIDIMKDAVLKLFTGKKFILIGQSFGSPMSLKFASILEAHGKTGHVVAIDGSPDWSLQSAKQMEAASSENDSIELWIYKFFIRTAFSTQANAVMKQVFSKRTWNERLTTLHANMKTQYTFSLEYLRDMLINAMVNRTKICLKFDEYLFPVLISTKITLLRASQTILLDYEEDYGLQKLCSQPIENIVLDGGHVSIISNTRIPEIINNLSN